MVVKKTVSGIVPAENYKLKLLEERSFDRF
jgi:hypothetical protein